MKKLVLLALTAMCIPVGGTCRADDFEATLRAVQTQAQEGARKSEKRRAEQGDWWKPLEERQDALEKLRDLVDPAVLEIRMGRGSGTGFLIDASGLVMTANHVVSGGDEAMLKSDHVAPVKAKVVARAPQRDIALLQIEGDKKDWPFLNFADYADVRRAQPVYSFGNALGIGIALHQGLVQRCESNAGNPYSICLQTSSTFGPGDSGGPTVNIRGEVVGMNSRIPGNARDMSFSVKGDLLQAAVAEYRKSQELADYGIEADFIMAPKRGGGIELLVRGAPQGSPLRQGDVVQLVDGSELSGDDNPFTELQKLTKAKGKDGSFKLSLLRREEQPDGTAAESTVEVEVPVQKLSRLRSPEYMRGPPMIFFGS